ADVADAMAAQQERRALAALSFKQVFDRRHRPSQACAVFQRERSKHRCDLVMRIAVESHEGLPSLGGQRAALLPAVRGEGVAADQSALLEALDDPAEIAEIEPEIGSDLLGREIVTMRKLVEHPRLAQRERALRQMLAEHAEFARIEAVERAHRSDPVL